MALRLAAAAALTVAVLLVMLLTRTPDPAAQPLTQPSTAPLVLPSLTGGPAATTGPGLRGPADATAAALPSTATASVTPVEQLTTDVLALEAITAWQAPTDQARTDALTSLATTEYQDAARTIDATRVPSAAPLTVRTRVEADGQALVDVELEDGTDLALVLRLEQDRWLLHDLRPVTAAEDGGAP